MDDVMTAHCLREEKEGVAIPSLDYISHPRSAVPFSLSQEPEKYFPSKARTWIYVYFSVE